ncbi:hypothetical protein [Urbifossiella limnaea]|uniref:Uncharacterized protein n=1 Tax=Urbifossiella limnaea TaxID=2528023 RepID=A0A517XUX2_9BACT|nr:hypothetical protein [Urbifossiella limnaea]QDU21302.1 hypothetical protein ETAA1_32680 [Urbifossiella limnaea]
MCVTLSAARPGPAAGEAFAAALPRVEAVARFATRRVPCPDAREELEAEAVALAWRCYVALLRRGKEPGKFVTTIARRAAQAALGGRRVCGAERARDVLSPLARLRGRVRVERLGDRDRGRRRRPGEVVAAELAAADPRVKVPDQAAFRVDFPRFRGGLTPASQAALDLLAAGWGTGAAAARLGVTPARVSQLRRELAEQWEAFHDGPA